MSPRTGRPPIENPRSESLNIRLTKGEAKLIQDCADALGMSRTDAIMKGIKMLMDEIKNE